MTPFEKQILKDKVQFFLELAEDNAKYSADDPYFKGKREAYKVAANSLDTLIEILIEKK